MTPFTRFIAIDWSGAKGPNYTGIAVAEATGDGPPRLVPPPSGRHWTRTAVLNFLITITRRDRALIGYDFSPALPYLDRCGYFQGGPADARALWHLVEKVSDGAPDLFAGDFVAYPPVHGHFWTGGARQAGFVERFRVTERACRDQGLGAAQSVFKLIGAAQVGKGSLAGMRMFHHLNKVGTCTFWPFDPDDGERSVMVEAFPRSFLKRAGFGSRKARAAADLTPVWQAFGSPPPRGDGEHSDHAWDALVTAAGLRALVSEPAYWGPSGMTPEITKTEGWIFGVD